MRGGYPVCEDENGCWIWLGARDNKGYGVVRRPDKIWKAHRWIYTGEHGPIPEGLQLDHLCRNKSCVNPAHLEPVTGAENTRRAHRLTRGEVQEIRELVANGVRQRVVAQLFGLTQPAVSRIARGKRQKAVF